MIRRIILSALFLMGSAVGASAQQAAIIAVEGNVQIRQGAQSSWEAAQVGQLIAQDGEIRTKKDSSCTVAFDAERKNIITVKDHSQVKIESILPGKVFLPEGRVFTLIKNLPANKQFEVRTPTAVSGARGTGWLTEFIGGQTTISCFDDVVSVDSLDSSGAATGHVDLAENLEVNVEEQAVVEAEDINEISEADTQEWNSFSESVELLTETIEAAEAAETTEATEVTEAASQEEELISPIEELEEVVESEESSWESQEWDPTEEYGGGEPPFESNEEPPEEIFGTHQCSPHPDCCEAYNDPSSYPNYPEEYDYCVAN